MKRWQELFLIFFFGIFSHPFIIATRKSFHCKFLNLSMLYCYMWRYCALFPLCNVWYGKLIFLDLFLTTISVMVQRTHCQRRWAELRAGVFGGVWCRYTFFFHLKQQLNVWKKCIWIDIVAWMCIAHLNFHALKNNVTIVKHLKQKKNTLIYKNAFFTLHTWTRWITDDKH